MSIAVVAGLVIMDSERTSPGPLARAHAEHPDLAGAEGCAACHGSFGTSLSGACCDCHEQIDDQVRSGLGLHGAVVEVGAEDCAGCHSEHLGAAFELSGARAFELAGFEREAFDHGHVEFALAGAHDRLDCEACHPAALAPVLAEGQPRFLGLEQTCASCHEDPHEGTFARGCATCHGQSEPFAALASFEHGGSFPLVGAHAGPTCAECHEPGSERAIEVLAGTGLVPAARSCGECHESPHAEPFIAVVASFGQRPAGETCALCHDAEGGQFTGSSTAAPLTRRPELHAGSGFELSVPHAELGCLDCHGALSEESTEPSAELSFEQRFPGRASNACEACHADPHGGQFEGRLSCNVCHAQGAAFVPIALGVEEHALTAFPLLASHAETECAACHVPPAADPAGPIVYAGTAQRCEACHDDVHEGAFEELDGTPDAEAGCAACHQPTSFADGAQADFEHELWTGFELTGAHARAECSACHPATAKPDAAGRSFGRVSATFGPDVSTCAACHEDVHAGAFDGVAGAAAADCADCHTSESFEDAALEPFEHADWTGFALEGAHERAECISCHGSGAEPAGQAASRRLGFVSDHYPGPAERCETCHADPHDGGFDGPGQPQAVEGREGCARCHGFESFASFAEGGGASSATFDHGLWTGYVLEGAHARAACTDCHARLLLPDARGRHLAPVPGGDCLSCHADPHLGQLTSAEDRDCASCHGSSERFDLLDFDHTRDTRFVLDEAHAPLECAVCHVPWPLPDGREVVRYKPLGTRCIDCHDHGGPHGDGE